jgi:hypothetical protein
MENYLPANEAELLNWLKNFSSMLPSVGVTLGITPAEAASLNALILDVKSDLRKEGLNGKDKEIKMESMFKFLNSLVVKMKDHPSFSSSYAEKLGIR